MSRSGYSDEGDCDQWSNICWRGAVSSALYGARGQAFLKELRDALDAMPVKELIAEAFKIEDGAACALGVVSLKRGVDLTDLNDHEDDYDSSAAAIAAERLGIAAALGREIVYMNDEGGSYGHSDANGKWRKERPDERWARIRMWVWREILPDDYVVIR